MRPRSSDGGEGGLARAGISENPAGRAGRLRFLANVRQGLGAAPVGWAVQTDVAARRQVTLSACSTLLSLSRTADI
jgi:hypothetical protein